jgi:Ras-related protein Rab-5C
VVDLSRKETLNNVQKWIDQIYSRTDIKNPSVMVLANKRDLETKRQISNNEIEGFQREQTTDLLFFEVSARNGQNINEAFVELSEKMLQKGQQRKVSGFRLVSQNSRGASLKQTS